MNAQSKNLTRIAAALVLAMACGNTWAVGTGNAVTFDGKGANNAGNIDAGSANSAIVTIRQVNTSDTYDANRTPSAMNQVGSYGVAGDKLTIRGSGTKVTIGQGAVVTGHGTFDGTDSASVNNLVKGNIAGGNVKITQTGTAGARLVNITAMAGGNLTTTQTGDNGGTITVDKNTGDVTVTQTGGTANILQKGTNAQATVTQGAGTLNINQNGVDASGQKVTVAAYNSTGTTTINQHASAASSELTLTSSGANGNYGGETGGITINQGQDGAVGAYQKANVTFENSGYNGTLNLNASGTAPVGEGAATYATIDVKM